MAKVKEVGTVEEVVAPVVDTPVVVPDVSEARARWDAYLAKARLDRVRDGSVEIFDAQVANHEFDAIPDSFL